MESGFVTGMWADLQKANKLPRAGTIAICEKELKELMRAIDIMVNQKRREWDNEKRALEAKLSVREQELLIQKTTLEQKHQEIGHLRSRLDSNERSSKDSSAAYEQQIDTVKAEVESLKKDYERMHRKYLHQVKELKREQEKLLAEVDDSKNQLARSKEKLEECKSRSKEWEQEKRNLQRQIESAQMQNSTLSHKLELSQHQCQTYQGELARNRDLLDTAETNLQRQVEQLQQQLDASRDTNNSQETQILRLKSAIETSNSSQKKLLAEKVELESSLIRLQQRVKRMEDEIIQLKHDLEMKREAAKISEESANSLSQQLVQLKQIIQENETKRETLAKQNSEAAAADEMNKLLEEINELKSEVRKRKKKEEKLQNQVSELQTELKTCQHKYGDLASNVSSRVDELTKQKSSEMDAMKAQLSKLKEDLAKADSKRVSEVEQMQATVAKLNSELVKNQENSKLVSQKVTAAEEASRDLSDQLNKRTAELQVLSVQLETVRLENRQLRRSHTTLQQNTDVNMLYPTDQLHDLEKSFQSSLNVVESHNERLEDEVQKLRQQLVSVEHSAKEKEKLLETETEREILHIREEEARRVKEAEEKGRKLARDVEEKLNSTINDYESHINSLRGQLQQMENELQSHDRSMLMLGMENDVMTHFIEDIDQIVKSTPAQKAAANGNQSQILNDSSNELVNASGDALKLKLENLQQQELHDVEQSIDACIDMFSNAVSRPNFTTNEDSGSDD